MQTPSLLAKKNEIKATFKYSKPSPNKTQVCFNKLKS